MTRLNFSDVKDLTLPALQLMGCSESESNEVLDNLYLANLMGHDSHGVGMIPRYVESYLAGHLQPNQTIRVLNDLETLIVIDGGLGFGQTVGKQALDLAIQRAARYGSCIFLLANAHHLGRIGGLAEIAASQKMISIFFVNVLSRPIVSVWGGTNGKHGTNPICVGVPRCGEPPFILDFATSAVAQGKMREAFIRKESVREGLLKDSSGVGTTDPSVVVVPDGDGNFGSLFPFGEHKGSGLAIACELLAGALSGGGAFKKENLRDKAIVNNLFGVLVCIDKVQDFNVYGHEVEEFLAWVKQDSNLSQEDHPLVAGEPEESRKNANERLGVDIPVETIEQILASITNLKHSSATQRK